MKVIYEKPTADKMLESKMLQRFAPKIRTGRGSLSASGRDSPDVPTCAERQAQLHDGRKEVNLFLFANGLTLYLESADE